MDLAAYLARIGHQGPREPGAATLAALHWAHARAIPFENLDILLGRPIRLEPEAIFAKLVEARRGGYCYEHNTLFAWVLGELGFRVTLLAARVRWMAPPDRATPRTHMLLRVDLDDGPWIADVGFGGPGSPSPLRLEPDREQPTPLDTYRFTVAGDRYTLASRVGAEWQPLYVFGLDEHHPIDFLVANHYTSTYPDSPFRKAIFCARPGEGVRHLLRGRDYAVRRGSEVVRRTLSDDDELLAVLQRDFDLAFPAGTRFSTA